MNCGERVENGWLIAWRLSDIAESVEKADTVKGPAPKRFLGIEPREATLVPKLESTISARRLEYVKHIGSEGRLRLSVGAVLVETAGSCGEVCGLL